MIHWLRVWINEAETVKNLHGPRANPFWPWTEREILDDGYAICRRPDQANDALLECQGHWCEKHQDELKQLAALGRVSRIDWARDHCPFSVLDLVTLRRDGNLKTSMRQARYIEDLNTEKRTLELGARISEKFARFYDQHGPVRAEFELKGKAANLIGKVYADTGKELWPAVANALMKITARRGREAALLDWRWEKFVGTDETITFPRKQASDLEAALKWLQRTVAPTMAAVAETLGGELPGVLDAKPNQDALARYAHQHVTTLLKNNPPGTEMSDS